MKQKKEWNDEDILEFLENSIKDLKQAKGDFQGLLVVAENRNDPERTAHIKDVISDINIQIKFLEAELKKRRIKKPS